MSKFVTRWLSVIPRAVEGNLSIEDIEVADFDSDALVSQLGQELKRNYTHSRELDTLLHSLGAEALGTWVANNKLPSDAKIRHGDFGEAIGSALLRHTKRYCLPILKLGYKTSANRSLFGLDIVAFRFTTEPPTVMVAEVKTHTSSRRNLNLGKVAYEQLNRSLTEKSLGEAVSFTFARITEINGSSCLATRLVGLLANEKIVERHIIIWHEKGVWDERVLERAAEAAQDAEGALVTVIQIDELANLIAAAYNYIGRPVGVY